VSCATVNDLIEFLFDFDEKESLSWLYWTAFSSANSSKNNNIQSLSGARGIIPLKEQQQLSSAVQDRESFSPFQGLMSREQRVNDLPTISLFEKEKEKENFFIKQNHKNLCSLNGIYRKERLTNVPHPLIPLLLAHSPQHHDTRIITALFRGTCRIPILLSHNGIVRYVCLCVCMLPL
jgi:hypothetical protein